MNKLTILFSVLVFFTSKISAQKKDQTENVNSNESTLIVGIVIDQMRADYLYRFQNNFTDEGFKKILKDGYNVKNAHYNYVPTATGPGHASVFTGTTPENHGIIANSWYSRLLNRKKYCAEDSTAYLVDMNGIERDMKYKSFKSSPKNVKSTTITDELKLSSNKRSKIIGISLKDRSAIFPAGHLADAAYWYNHLNGNFITSSYYRLDLPDWLKTFNARKRANYFLDSEWNFLLPEAKYTNSQVDNAAFEYLFKGKTSPTFPYNLKELRIQNNDFALLMDVPFGNSIVTEMAIAALQGEQLGLNNNVDFLTISYSSTDFIGHNFGIRSKEIEDTYIRMDREIATLLKALDKQVGKGRYTLFITSDHACSDHPNFLQANKLPGEFFSSATIKNKLNNYLSSKYYKTDFIRHMDKTQVYVEETSISKREVIREAANFLQTIDGVKEVFVPGSPDWNLDNSNIGNIIKNSYNAIESGDIFYSMYPGWMEERTFGTTHGVSYNNDTHVPLLWYGNKIKSGSTVKAHTITQIVPTLSFMYNIPLPSASDKFPIDELFD